MKIFKRLLPVLALLAINSASCSTMFFDAVESEDDVEIENQKLLTSNSSDSPLYAESQDNEPTTHKITWLSDLGNVLKVDVLPLNSFPKFEDTSLLVKPSDEEYSYTFSGWEPEIKKVTNDATYKATYRVTSNKYVFSSNYDEKFNLVSYSLCGVTENYKDESITLPTSFCGVPVNIVGKGNWANIKEIIVPEGYKQINSFAFSDSNVEKVIMPNSLKTLESNAFTYSKIKTITIPSGIEEIGDNAFSTCNELVSITFNAKVNIGKSMFERSKKLSQVNIGSGVKEIGSSAFKSCESLKQITLPDSLTTIGASAFEETSLTSIIIPNSVTSIGKNAFSYCYDLSDVTLSQNLEVISDSLFLNDTALESITLPLSVTEIKDYAFCWTKLKNVVLPDSITTIGENAFYDTDIVRVRLPARLNTLKKDAFTSCSDLTIIDMPRTINNLNANAFRYDSNISVVNYEGTREEYQTNIVNNITYNYYLEQPNSQISNFPIAPNTYESYTSFVQNQDKTLVIFKNYDGTILDVAYDTNYRLGTPTRDDDEENTYTFSSWSTTTDETKNIITKTANYTSKQIYYSLTFDFGNGETLKTKHTYNDTVTYPETRPTKSGYLFLGWDLDNLKNMPDHSVTINALYASKTSVGLNYLEKENGLNVVRNKSMETLYNENILQTYQENGETVITNDFECQIIDDYGREVTSTESPVGRGALVLPNNIDAVDFIFATFDHLVLSSSVKHIKVLRLNDNLRTIEIPSTVEVIDRVAFAYSSLEEIDLSNCQITTLEEGIFNHCDKLKKAVIGPKVERIYDCAFYDNIACEEITILGNNLKEIGEYAFATTTSLTKINIPSSVTSIGKGAFYETTSLKEIELPEGLETIGDAAFYSTGLEKVVVPTTVTTLGKQAFNYCQKLKEITLPTSITKINERTFRYTELEVINYRGTQAQFNNIDIVDNDDRAVINAARINYNYRG